MAIKFNLKPKGKNGSKKKKKKRQAVLVNVIFRDVSVTFLR
jgi:hypothetical protein